MRSLTLLIHAFREFRQDQLDIRNETRRQIENGLTLGIVPHTTESAECGCGQKHFDYTSVDVDIGNLK